MASLLLRSRAKLMEKLLCSPVARSAAPATRFFNTNAQMRDAAADERSLDVDRRADDRVFGSRGPAEFPSFFSDVLDPFGTTRSLSQVLNVMDQMLDNTFPGSSRVATRAYRGWDAREDENGLHLRIDMPGLDKEHVRVSAEQGTLVIKGECESELEDEPPRRYSSRVDLPDEVFKMDEIKAEMKNGVLKIMVPKVKEEERKDVYHVKIE
ncbi:HSP20 family protein [Dioscorea alata]|uniref:HSP20 family protein n=1 Tax=Dioscorea alata TaxID=55571 RepID=A0ACB7U5E9_DIOAL|nr:HSP20 family protein [Dioscorea alata]